MSAAFAASILPLDLALRGWDLAPASNQALRLSEEVTTYLRKIAESVVPGGGGRSFGPEVDPPLVATRSTSLRPRPAVSPGAHG